MEKSFKRQINDYASPEAQYSGKERRAANEAQSPKEQLHILFNEVPLSPEVSKISAEEISALIKAVIAKEDAERKERASAMHLTYTLTGLLSVVSATCLWMVGSACINFDRSKKFKV